MLIKLISCSPNSFIFFSNKLLKNFIKVSFKSVLFKKYGSDLTKEIICKKIEFFSSNKKFIFDASNKLLKICLLMLKNLIVFLLY